MRLRVLKSVTSRAAVLTALMVWMISGQIAVAQNQPQWPAAPPRPSGEGTGPFNRLIIEGGLVIDGTGAPPFGPATIVIERNRIVAIRSSNRADRPAPRPEIGPNDKLIDAKGSFILPGFIDTHTRIQHGVRPPTDYVLKLLLAHGITMTTSMQGQAPPAGVDWALDLQKQSAQNQITSPRIQVWADLPRPAGSPEEARAKVREYAQKGVSGLGEGAIYGPPEVKRAGLDEARKLGLNSLWHMDMQGVPRFNVLDAARSGMRGLSHFYGLPEAMFEDRSQQHWLPEYNFVDNRLRFQQSGRLWQQAAKPYSERWNKVMNELIALDFTLEPTFNAYEVNRDYMGVRRGEWHDEYLHPELFNLFQPSRIGLNFNYDWTSTNEVEWREHFRLWMIFVNEYKNRGGRVVAGDDGGYDWVNYGFGFIRNMELLHEAGFTPLEAISAATLKSAEFLHMDKEIGTIEEGKLADIVILDKNPLENLKYLYGTGVISLNDKDEVIRVGGVKYTIKDGIIFDAKALLADVRKMVSDAKARQKPTTTSRR